jgi:hypothetical protein
VVGLLGLVSCAKQPNTADTAASQTQSGVDGPAARAEVPRDLAWKASAPILVAKSDAEHDIVSIKDPTIVRFNERYHVYATTAARGGKWSMVYTSFRDFREAPAAPLYYMDQTPGFFKVTHRTTTPPTTPPFHGAWGCSSRRKRLDRLGRPTTAGAASPSPTWPAVTVVAGSRLGKMPAGVDRGL